MIKAIYSAGLAVASLMMLPRLFKHHGKTKLARLLGKEMPNLSSTAKVRIWAHAVSLGETKAIVPLLKKIKQNNPNCFVILSTMTETGQNEAKIAFPEADRHIYLPSDLVVRKFLKQAKPTLVLLSETDFWFNFLDEAKKQGSFVALVNGKISEKSLKFYRWIQKVDRSFFGCIDLFLVQSSHYEKRFIDLGIEKDKIFVTGNLKLDESSLVEMNFFAEKSPVLVIGSTHETEELLFLKALKGVWSRFPDLKVYLVPRHPERFEEVARIIESENIDYIRFTDQEALASTINPKLVLVDKMGELKNLYAKADICIVAGSFTPKVGGHNILEPCCFGKITVFGPYMFSQPDFLELVLKGQAGLQVPIDEIASTILYLMDNPEISREMGARGKRIIQENLGSLEKTLHLIQHKC